ncbi:MULTISPECIES: hypothetical protein [unclassified Pseudomonas]|uniref:hypothetical protein n=1 Tax=unclassified Pseudomonas TaxID=196821 RepID=UPI001179F3F0|nr:MULTISPECIES: hypothetical protein [unclassified Pseudomonas]
MTDKKIIQRYINNFRRKITPALRPGIGVKCIVHPATPGGAVLEFKFVKNGENDDQYKSNVPSLSKALSTVEQKAFGGNLEAFKFSGTNVILDPSKVIIIKDGNPSEWSEHQASKDVDSIFNPGRGLK